MRIKELGHIVLYVTNLEVMARFYRETLGFKEIARDEHTALYSSGRTHHELLLIEVGGHPQEKKIEPGLYHIGFKVANSTEELKEVYKELSDKNVKIIGTADHGVTHSIYILDPDGNELELYADVNDAWKRDPKAILAPVRPLDLS